MAGETKLSVVVGLGEIGRPLLSLLHRSSARALGVDRDPVTIAEPVGILHLCLPFDLDGAFLAMAQDYATKYDPELIVINSTVAPGTTRQLQGHTHKPCVFSPVRGKHVRMEEDLRHYTKFVAALDPEAAHRAAAQFAAAGMRTEHFKTPESLELGKLYETTYLGLLVAWAQEMDRFARSSGGDYLEAARLFCEVDYLPRRIFVPGHVGGHCVMPNVDLLLSKRASPLLEAIKASNADKARDLGPDRVAEDERIEPLAMEAKGEPEDA